MFSFSAKETNDVETKTLFRNLVTGQYTPYMGHAFHKLSFQTVFYI